MVSGTYLGRDADDSRVAYTVRVLPTVSQATATDVTQHCNAGPGHFSCRSLKTLQDCVYFEHVQSSEVARYTGTKLIDSCCSVAQSVASTWGLLDRYFFIFHVSRDPKVLILNFRVIAVIAEGCFAKRPRRATKA
jgi:hypothetical protein